jgi:predicted transcriptional regulator
MEHPYSTLQTIYNIVKDDSDPTSYPCKPAQIIVRQFLPWDTILEHIHQLAKQGLVEIQQQERFTLVRITREGFALCHSGGTEANIRVAE